MWKWCLTHRISRSAGDKVILEWDWLFSLQEFGRATANLKFESFDGGRDSRERMTQGLVVALRSAAPRTLIVVFTDNGTKDLRWTWTSVGLFCVTTQLSLYCNCVLYHNILYHNCVCAGWRMKLYDSGKRKISRLGEIWQFSEETCCWTIFDKLFLTRFTSYSPRSLRATSTEKAYLPTEGWARWQ